MAPPPLLYGELSKVLCIPVHMYPVMVRSESTGDVYKDTVPVALWQLQAAQARDETVDAVISQLCDEQGCTLLDIGQPEAITVEVNLENLTAPDIMGQNNEALYRYDIPPQSPRPPPSSHQDSLPVPVAGRRPQADCLPTPDYLYL